MSPASTSGAWAASSAGWLGDGALNQRVHGCRGLARWPRPRLDAASSANERMAWPLWAEWYFGHLRADPDVAAIAQVPPGSIAGGIPCSTRSSAAVRSTTLHGLRRRGQPAPASGCGGGCDGRLVAISDRCAATACRRLDVTGLAVATGFIDLHTHSEFTPGLWRSDLGRAAIGRAAADLAHANQVRRDRARLEQHQRDRHPAPIGARQLHPGHAEAAARPHRAAPGEGQPGTDAVDREGGAVVEMFMRDSACAVISDTAVPPLPRTLAARRLIRAPSRCPKRPSTMSSTRSAPRPRARWLSKPSNPATRSCMWACRTVPARSTCAS